MSSRTGIGLKDLEKLEKKIFNLAENAGVKIAGAERSSLSLAMCFDALLTVLDRRFDDPTKPGKLSDEVKAELEERRKQSEAKKPK